MKTRIYFLDHLRTFAIFLVVLIHAGIVYEYVLENIWLVVDPAKSGAIGLVRMYLDLFVMYTIFFVSGYFMPDSVEKYSTAGFLKAKFKRILAPWILAVFTLIPAYKMIFLYSRGMPQEEWYSYFHIFQRAGSDLTIFSNNPSQNWLWFLPVLFVFQAAYLGLWKARLFPLKISVKTGVVLAFVIGVVYSMAISSAGLTGWLHSGFLEFQRERLLPYFLVFLLGALCREQRVFEAPKNMKLYILANVVLTIALGVFTAVALNLFFNLIDPARNYFFVSSFVDRAVYYITALLSMFSFLYVMLHTFRFSFNKTNNLMNQLNKNSYSVYIIHVIVLGLIALPMVPLAIPAFVKYLMLTILTFVVSNILVYAYRRLLKPNVYLRAAATCLAIVAFFTVTCAGKQGASTMEQPEHALAQQNNVPGVGLHEAVIQGNVEAVRQHIKAGADLDEREPSGGSSPLITAAVFGKTEIALLLIDAGASLDLQNNEGSTALITAAFFCREEIVKALLANGADPKIRNNAGSTALDAVSGPFEDVKEIYDYFRSALGPLGLNLDYEQIRKDRPRIAAMLQK
ncbi:MAG: acyltransferase family protein [Lewinellaceae bacterium]|nr:acyltransferase family protein [Lewinellaceae bacterium]MCB9289943.1 acyltransferase family protein [Lewinellaceae bacterium]